MKTNKKEKETGIKNEMKKLTKKILKEIKGGDGGPALPIDEDFD